MLATLAIFVFPGVWNDFLWPLVVTTSENMRTIPVGLAFVGQAQLRRGTCSWPGSVSRCCRLVIYVLGQKWFVRGIAPERHGRALGEDGAHQTSTRSLLIRTFIAGYNRRQRAGRHSPGVNGRHTFRSCNQTERHTGRTRRYRIPNDLSRSSPGMTPWITFSRTSDALALPRSLYTSWSGPGEGAHNGHGCRALLFTCEPRWFPMLVSLDVTLPPEPWEKEHRSYFVQNMANRPMSWWKLSPTKVGGSWVTNCWTMRGWVSPTASSMTQPVCQRPAAAHFFTSGTHYTGSLKPGWRRWALASRSGKADMKAWPVSGYAGATNRGALLATGQGSVGRSFASTRY